MTTRFEEMVSCAVSAALVFGGFAAHILHVLQSGKFAIVACP